MRSICIGLAVRLRTAAAIIPELMPLFLLRFRCDDFQNLLLASSEQPGFTVQQSWVQPHNERSFPDSQRQISREPRQCAGPRQQELYSERNHRRGEHDREEKHESNMDQDGPGLWLYGFQ